MGKITARLLKEVFKYHTLIEVGDYFIYNDFEVYHTITEESVQYNSIEELIDGYIDGESIGEALNRIKFDFDYSGGRGGSWGGATLGGGFGHADGRGKGKGGGKALFPSEFNTQGRFVTQEKAIELFTKKYGEADIEYGISVDKDGFVHKHVQGGKTSVMIGAHGKDHMVVHNHPSGGAFSDTDLINAARDSYSSGIVATSSNSTYILRKGPRFDAKGFAKAVKKAQWPKNMGYDQGADWWLRKNAATYGYKYSRKGGAQNWIKRKDFLNI